MAEGKNRLFQLQTMMQAANIDLVAIGPTANMRYLLGYVPHPDERLCLLLISSERVKLVVPTLNAGDVAAHTDLPLEQWPDAEGPFQALRRAVSGLPIKRLAIDGTMRADFLLPLLAATNQPEAITVEGLLAPLRARKSAEEIEALALAAAQAGRAMQAAMEACRPGVTEAEVAWIVEETFRKDGAEAVTFSLVASGPHGAFPHHHSGPRRLQGGDAVIIDIGATLNGYQSDITRMVFIGEPPADFLRAYEAVLAANERGRAAVRPGIMAQEVDRATRSTLEAAGYGDYFIHRTGHGLGLEIHEAPYIMAGSELTLEVGMVFSVEPGIYLPGQFGIRIEDIVAVTETGARTLTGFDRQLVIKK
ncbi:MAG: Xaa-Pro peptidase family protein [Anaerolineae bacterium]|nr:Xaa-Pro peptidase family protein [Anaerolineae bacterium]